MPRDVRAGGALHQVAQASGSASVAREEVRGGELVWSPELVDVVPPLFQERAERHRNPLVIDLLVPECDKPWCCDAVPGEATGIANPEGVHGGTCHGEEGSNPSPVASAAPQLLKVLPRGPDSGLGEVRGALGDGPHLEPHARGNHCREQLQFGQHLEPGNLVASHRSTAPSVAKQEEAAVHGKLYVSVAAVARECVADSAQVRVSCAFGERPCGKR